MRVMLQLLLLAMVSLLVTGCTTIYGDTGMAEEEARVDLEMQNMRAQVDRLQARVLESEQERQILHRRLDAVEGELQTIRQDTDSRVRGVETAMSGYESARVRDREEVVNQLSKKVSDIVRTTPAPTQSRARVAEGYEHVVQPGETLSAIATAYGTRSSAIIEANDLKNPDSLRAGQKLFIPE